MEKYFFDFAIGFTVTWILNSELFIFTISPNTLYKITRYFLTFWWHLAKFQFWSKLKLKMKILEPYKDERSRAIKCLLNIVGSYKFSFWISSIGDGLSLAISGSHAADYFKGRDKKNISIVTIHHGVWNFLTSGFIEMKLIIYLLISSPLTVQNRVERTHVPFFHISRPTTRICRGNRCSVRVTSAPSPIEMATSASCQMITCAEVNDLCRSFNKIFQNLCRSSPVPKFVYPVCVGEM